MTSDVTGVSAVLCYHRVSPAAEDPHGLAVDPADFADHVDLLARRCGIVPLARVLDAPGIAITFDDGYADNATVAAPILEARDAPATFFVTTGVIGRSAPFWWDRLASALLGDDPVSAPVELEINGRMRWIDLRDDAARDRAHAWLHTVLRPLPAEEIARVVAAIADGAIEEEPRAMRGDELQALDVHELFDVGAHTVNHVFLATQPEAVQAEEIAGSRRDLEALLDRPVTTFAYPFGGTDAADDTTVRVARDAGIRLACTTTHRRVERGDDPLRVPRFVVGGGWDAERLDRQLSRWLGG